MRKIFTGQHVVCAVLVVDGAFEQFKIKWGAGENQEAHRLHCLAHHQFLPKGFD